MGEDVGLPVGDPAFTGEPVGEALGLGLALAVADGDGLAVIGLFDGVSDFGSHALKTATLAAKIADKMKDLLIVFLLTFRKHGHWPPDGTDINSRTDAMRLSAEVGC